MNDDIFNYDAHDAAPVKNATALVPILPPQWSGHFHSFGADVRGMPVVNNKFGSRAALAVMRWHDEPSLVDVIARIGGVEVKLSMTAAELRDAASALVSAAYALEDSQ